MRLLIGSTFDGDAFCSGLMVLITATNFDKVSYYASNIYMFKYIHIYQKCYMD